MKKNNYDEFCEMLKKIQKNPFSYLSSLSLEYLRIFLLGCELCPIPNNFSFRLQPRFHTFIEEKYGFKSNHHPLMIISFFEPNEERAFNMFFELLHEFNKTQDFSVEEREMSISPSEYKGVNLVDEYYILLNEWIRKHPRMYLKTPSIKYLETFINGYFTCAKIKQIPFEPHNGFDKFVQAKFKIEKQMNPFKTIDFMYWNDGEEAFYKFFELIDEFRGRK